MDNTLLKSLPTSPGVYKMLDEENNIIYIGKAGNLKKRVSSYFMKSNHSLKNQRLISKIKDIDYQITSNEQDALLLENNLIKEYKPKYNILLRDDKSYPYISLNKKHEFPGFKFYRGKPSKDGQHFGPYTHVVNVRKILSIIQKTFLVRLCEDSYYKTRTKPCLQYQIKRCSAPCVGLIDKDSYDKSITNATMFLKGETLSLFEKLEKEMSLASSVKNYEVAAKHRDNIALIRNIASHYSIFPEDKSIDFILCLNNDTKVLVDINIIRNGINMGCKNFTFNRSEHEDLNETLTSFFKQYYLTHIPPNLIISEDKILDRSNIELVLNKKFKQKAKILNKIEKKYSEFINLCKTNLQNRSLKSIKRNKNSLTNLNIQLDLVSKFILCFDVSHISGSSSVGSSVFFDENGFDKSNYRKFNIKSSKKSDDYGALKEIIKRRLLKIDNYKNENMLIIVDGGKGQITQAKNIINILGCKNISVIGIHKGLNRLSKHDRVLNQKNIDISNEINNEALTLIQTIRDEAHRFAILNQRKRHNKLMFNSKLDGIPGIGDERKKTIINHFGGIQGVLKASIRELKLIDGISEKLANSIYTNIHK